MDLSSSEWNTYISHLSLSSSNYCCWSASIWTHSHHGLCRRWHGHPRNRGTKRRRLQRGSRQLVLSPLGDDSWIKEVPAWRAAETPSRVWRKKVDLHHRQVLRRRAHWPEALSVSRGRSHRSLWPYLVCDLEVKSQRTLKKLSGSIFHVYFCPPASGNCVIVRGCRNKLMRSTFFFLSPFALVHLCLLIKMGIMSVFAGNERSGQLWVRNHVRRVAADGLLPRDYIQSFPPERNNRKFLELLND